MKPQNLVHILMAIVCLALSPQTQAVNPPHTPDPPPLPISNTADGDLALAGLAGGIYNSAFGFYSLLSNGAANFNTGVGAGVLLVNTADEQTAVGAGTLFSNTTGANNTGCGTFALFTNSTGEFNNAVGANSLLFNVDGNSNNALGESALLNNTSGSENTAVGDSALSNNTTGSRHTAVGSGALENCIAPPDFAGNTAVGTRVLFSDTTGNFNTAIGDAALFSNTIGAVNTAIGLNVLVSNTEGSSNTATGGNALFNNTTGTQNTANGVFALFSNTTGNTNTAVGLNALNGNATGSSNTAVGLNALHFSTGNGNTALGNGAGVNVATVDNVICIGSAGADQGNTCFIGNIRGVTTQNGDAVPVLIDSAGQLGTASSSARFKKEIKPMDKASEAILALKPVTFQYKTDKTSTPQFGLIAEQVAEVNPNLVVPDKDGEIYTVRYDAVNAMLLNEFLKEHRKVEQLEKQIEALTAGLQKVSAQIELSKRAPQTVLNNH
jgi:Chaperone of endosialidase